MVLRGGPHGIGHAIGAVIADVFSADTQGTATMLPAEHEAGGPEEDQDARSARYHLL